MSPAAGNVNWHTTGEGLLFPTAREVARMHGVPLGVVLRGFHVPRSHDETRLAEDHVMVHNGAYHVIKFADYSLITQVCRPRRPCGHSVDHSHLPDCPAKKKRRAACPLEEYKRELEEKFGSASLDPWLEEADVLGMEARREFKRELVDKRKKVIDIVESAVQELESIADQLLAAGTQPSLLGFSS